jgi:pre-rRNA-processing protein TSR2
MGVRKPSLVAFAVAVGGTDDERDRRGFEIISTSKLTTKNMSNLAPPSTSLSFARGVIARLALWPALRIAVQNGWGGLGSGEKRTWMASTIVDAFEEQSTPPDAEYIEELLLQIMDDEFETVIEDGSVESVAKDVTKLWEDIRLGDLAGLHHLEQQASRISNKPVAAQPGTPQGTDTDSDGEGGDWESDEEHGDDSDLPPDLESPKIDEDGFTTVEGRYTKHR